MAAQLRPAEIAPDGSLLYATSGEGSRLVDLVSGQFGPIISLKGNTNGGYSRARFSPDSRWLTIEIDQKIAVFEARRLLDMTNATVSGTTVVNGRQVQRPPVSTAPPVWLHQIDGFVDGDFRFSSSSELLARVESTTVYSTGSVSVLEVRSGKTVFTIPTNTPAAVMAAFVPSKPVLVTGDTAGTALSWDIRKLLFSGDDPSVAKAKSDDQLWSAMSDPDPSVAYRAGFVLMDRQQLVARAIPLMPLSQVDPGSTDQIHLLIAQLDSPVSADREKAHKVLEGKGAAAIAEVRIALGRHPGGELEERLTDIARVIGADDPTTPVPSAAAATTMPVVSADLLRTARVVQLLEWCDDPKAREQHDRLSASH